VIRRERRVPEEEVMKPRMVLTVPAFATALAACAGSEYRSVDEGYAKTTSAAVPAPEPTVTVAAPAPAPAVSPAPVAAPAPGDRAAATPDTPQAPRVNVAQIKSQLRKDLAGDSRLSVAAKQVEILATSRGKMTIRGTVKTQTERALVESHARHIPGVVEVENQIDVKP
jgi:hypothetical protein